MAAEDGDLAAAADIPWVVDIIATLLERVTECNDQAAAAAAAAGPWMAASSVFRAERKPGISIRAYMARIAKYAECSPACFVAAYIYLHRHDAMAVLDSYSAHRLILTAVLAAVKFMDAGTCGGYLKNINAYFARVGGISGPPEMNRLELEFLFAVDFDLNVPPNTFDNYCAMLRFEMLSLEPEAPLPLP